MTLAILFLGYQNFGLAVQNISVDWIAQNYWVGPVGWIIFAASAFVRSVVWSENDRMNYPNAEKHWLYFVLFSGVIIAIAMVCSILIPSPFSSLIVVVLGVMLGIIPAFVALLAFKILS